jgi:hypothetical protein
MVERMRKPLALVAAFLLAGSLAAGCGGDDSGDDNASTTVSGGSAADDATTTTGDGDATTTTDGGDATDAPTGGANPDSDYCHAALTFTNDPDLSNASTNVFSDPALVAHAIDLLGDMHDAAPDDIKDDLQTFIDAFEAIGTALQQAGDDPTAQQEALAGIQDQFTDLQAASDNVQQFTQTECGIDVDDTDSTTTTAG